MEQARRSRIRIPDANIAGAQALLSEMRAPRRVITPFIGLDIQAPMASDAGSLISEQKPSQGSADPLNDRPSATQRIGGYIAAQARRMNSPSKL